MLLYRTPPHMTTSSSSSAAAATTIADNAQVKYYTGYRIMTYSVADRAVVCLLAAPRVHE